MMVSIQEADEIVLRWQQMMRRGMMRNLKADERKKLEVPSSYFRFRLGTLPREVKSLRQLSESVPSPNWENLQAEGLIVIRMTCLHSVKVLRCDWRTEGYFVHSQP